MQVIGGESFISARDEANISCVVLTTLTGYPLYVKSAVHELFSCGSSVKFGARFAESLSTTQSPVQQSAIVKEKIIDRREQRQRKINKLNFTDLGSAVKLLLAFRSFP